MQECVVGSGVDSRHNCGGERPYNTNGNLAGVL